MNAEVRPLGVTCNLACTYCYEHPVRDAGNFARDYDLDAIKRAVEAEGADSFSLFGGEALLMPLSDLKELWRWGYERFGRNGIQTNGALITDKHIELFKRYNVNVGISIDGPDELNDVRWAGSLEKTREATRRTMQAIDKLLEAGLKPGLIVTLHRGNASPERLPRLKDWFRELDQKGIQSARLHILEVDHPLVRARWALSDEENLSAFIELAKLERELKTLRFDVFRDILAMLKGEDGRATCIWQGCDAWTTHAVRGIEAHGERSNCSRTNKDGVDWFKADQVGFERYLALYQTPQEDGGCQGCRFWLACKGNCPATAIDGDWRNRSEHCRVWFGLMEYFEAKLLDVGITPISQDPKRQDIERYFLARWVAGERPTIQQARQALRGGRAPVVGGQCHPGGHGDQITHGDHYDTRGAGQ
ncbi:MAG: radical SAM protein [Limnochordales bacterium]|nr:radical SAM protein [Limnochordales bacterium]